MTMAVKTMDDAFYMMMQDVYYAEKQLLKALKKMAKNASDPKLEKAFLTHRDETEGQIQKLDEAFELIGKKARGKKCEAILGIIAEGDEVMEEVEDEAVLDAGLIAAAQAAEHYEIARYGTLVAWAKQGGKPQVARILSQILEQEKKTDLLLSKMAESEVNPSAA
jgi:ferritin-like metal-binding protein YciE